MGGLREIFLGMSRIVGQAEMELASKINDIAGSEMDATDSPAIGIEDGGTETTVAPENAGGEGGGVGATGDLSTEELLALQYDVQRFSIFNNMATSTMQTVAGAYQSVTGNLNFR